MTHEWIDTIDRQHFANKNIIITSVFSESFFLDYWVLLNFRANLSLLFLFTLLAFGFYIIRRSTLCTRVHEATFVYTWNPRIPISQTRASHERPSDWFTGELRYWEPLWFNRVNYDEYMPAAFLSHHYNLRKKIAWILPF